MASLLSIAFPGSLSGPDYLSKVAASEGSVAAGVFIHSIAAMLVLFGAIGSMSPAKWV